MGICFFAKLGLQEQWGPCNVFLGGSSLHRLRFNGDRELTALVVWYLAGSWPLTACKHVLAIEGRFGIFSGLGQEAAAPCLWWAPQKAEERCPLCHGKLLLNANFFVHVRVFSFILSFFFLKASQLGLRRKAAV